MKLLYGHSDEVEQVVCGLIPRCRHGFGKCQAVGFLNQDGVIVGGWVWHDYDPEAHVIEFSGASVTPKWMTRRILHELFDYAFNGVGCQMVVTRNSANNTRVHRPLRAYGFDRFDIPRLFGRDEDGVAWTLTDDQWRASRFYLGDRNEQAGRANAA